MSDRGEVMSLEAETDFGLSVLREQNLNGSVVFSPLSIALALALVHVGAKGKTQEQIGNALLKGKSAEEFQKYFAAVSKDLQKNINPDVQVSVANRLFSRADFPIQESYVKSIKELFDATAINLNFNEKQATAQTINDFVNDTTKGKISKIVTEDAVSSDTMAFLVNALYFKGDWFTKFKRSDTRKADFFRDENSSRPEDFLASKQKQDYAENENWQMLSLPYEFRSFSFNVFLPKKRFGVQEGLKSLTAADIQNLLNSTSRQLVEAKLPRFKVETELQLVETLKKVGVHDVFDRSADLSGIGDGLFVSDVIHKAIIEVDEEGTTAAAATAVKMVLKSAVHHLGKVINFTADHPFFFVLAKDKHPIFIGIYQ